MTEIRNFYGRRHGKTLRPSQRGYLAEDLPRLTLPGVTSHRWQDGDPANNHDVLLRQKDGSIEGYQNGHLIRRPGA